MLREGRRESERERERWTDGRGTDALVGQIYKWNLIFYCSLFILFLCSPNYFPLSAGFKDIRCHALR